MRSKLAVFVMAVALAAVTAQAQNQISNWEFDEPGNPLDGNWNDWEGGNFTGVFIVENAGMSGRYAMKVDIAGVSLDPLQFFYSFLKLEQGKTYYISFMAKADAPRPMSVGLEARALYSWVTYWSADVQLTTKVQTFTFEYTHTGATVGGTGIFDSDIDLQFWIAGNGTDLYIDRVWMGTTPPPPLETRRAMQPLPDPGKQDVPADTSLSWVAGKYAAKHSVYLGQSFDDVNNATVGSALLVSAGQTGTTYQPTALLEYGKTYYWRVDEVNAAPTNTVFKGEVWDFTVEPYAYPITAISASASSFDEGVTSGADRAVDGSGLTNDLHGTSEADMWVTNPDANLPGWIMFTFDKTYLLSSMLVWNYNSEWESIVGYGFKDVTIEYSLDGTEWTSLGDKEFAQAEGLPDCAPTTTVDLTGVVARYVRLTANTNWCDPDLGLQQCGLSEVRFYYVPTQARGPQPAAGAKNVAVDASLDWRPGRDATSHQVYFGTDKAAVTDGAVAPQTVAKHGFTPAALGFGTTYYWKVDEIGTATYPGDVWKFTTLEYQGVDNFESYTDQDGFAVWQTWIDGVGTDTIPGNGTGAMVGLLDPVNGTYCATDIVHGGGQSMPFAYDNTQSPYYSEATRTFDDPQDWAVNGADSLVLYFQGYPTPTTVPVTETAGKMTLTGGGTDIWGASDQFTFAYKTLNGDGTLQARVVSIGPGTNPWSKGGVMVRNSLDGASASAQMCLTANTDGAAGNGACFQNRATFGLDMGANDATSHTPSATVIAAPYWVKIERKGDTINGYLSANGVSWSFFSSVTIAMNTQVYIGLCATSGTANNEQRTYEFDNISSTGGVSGAWQGAAITAPRYNDTAGLYVTVEDKAGTKKTVVNSDPAATNQEGWKTWAIDYSELAGVSLSQVKKLTIGVGDPANPKAGGAGQLYFDDIQFGKAAVIDRTNLAVNGSFEDGQQGPWWSWGGSGATVTADVATTCVGAAVPEGPIEGKYCLHLTVSGPSNPWWDCAFGGVRALPKFAAGTKYTLSAFFKVKSGTGKVNMKLEHAGGNWEGHPEQQFTITDKWTEYHITSEVFAVDVSPMALSFHVGFQAQEIWIDDIKFYEGDYVPTK